MFTGLIEELGKLEDNSGDRFVFSGSKVLEDIALEASIAVNGVCLTVVDHGDNWWAADISAETRSRTTLGNLVPGAPVNFERAVQSGQRLGGHLVQGHVDDVGHIVQSAPDLQVKIPSRLCKYVVEKGSIAVDGVSLTVVDDLEDGFTVAIIPVTMAATTIGHLKPGDPVNIEIDSMARYIEKMVAHFQQAPTQ